MASAKPSGLHILFFLFFLNSHHAQMFVKGREGGDGVSQMEEPD